MVLQGNFSHTYRSQDISCTKKAKLSLVSYIAKEMKISHAKGLGDQSLHTSVYPTLLFSNGVKYLPPIWSYAIDILGNFESEAMISLRCLKKIMCWYSLIVGTGRRVFLLNRFPGNNQPLRHDIK